jgi:hypothetical protein
MDFLSVISHRGNLRGPKPEEENKPSYIDEAIDEYFEVEVDIRYLEGSFYLGHDKPEHFVDLYWLKERGDYLIFHCKNREALFLLKDNYHCFYHINDPYTLTSKHKIWTYPGQEVGPDCIIVDQGPPLKEKILNWKKKGCHGVCSNYADVIGSDILPGLV